MAFSGEVDDPESLPEPATESSKLLNPGLKGQDIREGFARPDYHLLLVANKLQTGFGQPLLCGMYVDKMLGGIQAVQTISRLDRAHPGKDTTYILDFVNEPAELSWKPRRAQTLSWICATSWMRAAICDNFEVERVAKVESDLEGTQAQLSTAIAPVADRLLKRYRAAQQAKAAADTGGGESASKAADMLRRGSCAQAVSDR